ncbi:hypothetical protein PVT67_08270 [Gallaecimonas kandeliae]|uniref:hypothetical protein n=1 Tax=Gallaecimonas kandeliae TaxID=3029055 RepID=UPI0026496093|nr:hypothetical protein [Gallaecimonas kandeliae]WKE67217.1 hypothetical protein PVT67_08270 [Gallaecimonas kandeliae]
MKILRNAAIWLGIMSLLVGMVGLVATFVAGEEPSGVMLMVAETWAKKGWILPYSCGAALMCALAYRAFKPAEAGSNKDTVK